MLYQGVMITNASGKLNGSVASHNRGGPYFRSMYTGVQPDPTPEQQVMRDAMALCYGRWRHTLTSAQRAAWKAYSQQHPRPNRIGIARAIGALPEFTRANVIRQQVNEALTDTAGWADDPPAQGTATEPAPTVSLAAAILTIAWDAASLWPADAGARLIVYTSEQRPLTINFFTTPYTIRAAIPGNAGTPTSSPQTVTLPFTPTTDQRIFVRLRITRGDGSLSMPFTYAVDGNP